jgi:hypothetical protein
MVPRASAKKDGKKSIFLVTAPGESFLHAALLGRA